MTIIEYSIMRQNQATPRMLEVLRKSHPLILSESELSKTYTPLRKAMGKNILNHSGTYKPSEQFRVNTLNNTMCSRIDESCIEQTSNTGKKRTFFNHLKANLASLRDSSGILRNQVHSISLFLKKSDMLADDLDCKTAGKIIEMESPLIKVILRIARNYDTISLTLDEITERNTLLMKQNLELHQKLRIQEEIIREYHELTRSQKTGKLEGMNNAKLIFTKFKQEEEQKSMQLQHDNCAKEQKYRDEKEQLYSSLDTLKKKIDKIENQKLKLVQALDCKLFQIKGINISISKLQQQNRIMNQKDKAKDGVIRKLQKTVEELKEGLNFRELWQMTCEQLEQIKILRHQQQLETVRLNRKYRIVKERLGNFMENKYIDIPEDCGKQKEELKMIMNSINQWSGHTKAALNQKQLSQVEKVMAESVNKNPIEKILLQYRQGLPSFFVFIEYHEERISYQLKHINSKSISNDFFLRMRAIFDSKFNQFWCSDNDWKKFPDFTIGFLEKFDICKVFKRVQLNLNSAEHIQNMKVNFFVDLFNPKIKEVWECDMFKMFLMEQYSQDQLFFFLSCRNLIFNGNMLQNSISSSDPIVFITLERAVKTVQSVLSRYDRSVIEKVKFGLQLKKKRKSSRYFIDSHFLLKILLDIYSSERQRRLQFYEATLGSLQSKNPKGCKYVNFKNFKRFMAMNYQFLSIADIAEMYRECYNISKGEVTYSVVFALASDRLFVRQLKQTPLLPLLRSTCISPYAEVVIKLHNSYEDSRYLDKSWQQLGLQTILSNVQEFKKSSSLTFESELNMGKLLSAIQQSQVISSVTILEILKRKNTSNIEDVLDKQIMSSLNWQLQQIRSTSLMGEAKQKAKANMRMAAQKLCLIFKNKIQQIYKSFDDGINKKLVELSK